MSLFLNKNRRPLIKKNTPEEYITIIETPYREQIRQGLEKKIIRYHNEQDKTEYAVVYIHGYGASSMEMNGVPEGIAENLGAHLFLTRLTGHGLNDPEKLGDAKAEEWLADIDEAITVGETLGEKVILITHSFAVMPALITMAIRRYKLAVFFAFSPHICFHPFVETIFRSPFAPLLLRLSFGKYRTLKAEDPRISNYWTVQQPTRSIIQMARLSAMVRRLPLAQFETPFAFIYSQHDTVINPTYVRRFFLRMGTCVPKMLYAPPWARRHTFAGNILAPENTEKLVTTVKFFVNSFARQ